MKALAPLLFLMLVSCGPTAYLVTDSGFRAASPAVVRAWNGLAPWHDARTLVLDTPSTADLDAALGQLVPGTPVLVAVALAVDQREGIRAKHPKLRLRFAGKAGGTAPFLSVNRQEAWALVAQAAAVPQPGLVLLPQDTTSDEQSAFLTAWTRAGGGPMTVVRWPSATPIADGNGPLFDWAGPPADPLVRPQIGRRPIHGDPGTPTGTLPRTIWAIQEAGLGDFLWKIVGNSTNIAEFLPLETSRTSR